MSGALRQAMGRIGRLAQVSLPQALSAVVGFVAAVAYARYMEQEQYGLYILLLAAPALILSVADFGIGQVALKYGAIASQQEDETDFGDVVRYSLAFRGRVAIIVTVFAPIFGVVFGNIYHQPTIVALFTISIATGVWSSSLGSSLTFVQVRQLFGTYATLRSLQMLPPMIAVGASILSGRWDLETVLWVNLVSQLVLGIATHLIAVRGVLSIPEQLRLLVVRRLPRLPDRISTIDGQNGRTSSRLFALLAILAGTMAQIETLVIGSLLSPSDAAVYSVAMKMASPITMVIAALGTLLWAGTYRHTETKTVLRAIRLNTVMTTGIAFVLVVYAILAPWLFNSIFPSNYSESLKFFGLICSRYIAVVVLMPLYVFANALGYQRIAIWVNAVNLVAYLVSAFLFLEHFGVSSLLYTNLAIEALVAVATGVFVLQRARGDRL